MEVCQIRALPDIMSSPEVRQIFNIRTVPNPDVFLPRHQTFELQACQILNEIEFIDCLHSYEQQNCSFTEEKNGLGVCSGAILIFLYRQPCITFKVCHQYDLLSSIVFCIVTHIKPRYALMKTALNREFLQMDTFVNHTKPRNVEGES